MTLNEVAQLFGKSRRTIMRMVKDDKLPYPVENTPMSWDAAEIKAARKRLQEEERDGRKHNKRNGRRRRKRSDAPRD